MARKALGFLQAVVHDGIVHLSACKTAAAFEGPQDSFSRIRIFRRHEPSFEFGTDYGEYFDGLACRPDDLLFEGCMEPENNRKFTFLDRSAQPGQVYAYWMAGAEGDPTGPVAVKVRHPEVWWSQQRIQAEIERLCRQHSELVHAGTVGRTARDQPIRAVRVGTADRCIALVGAVHAGESGAELMLPALGRLLRQCPNLFRRISAVAVPCLGSDERQRLVQGVPWYLRTNANGVDLNRTFPADWQIVEYGYGLDSSDPTSMTYRGPHEASEPETRAVMDFITAHCPIVVFSFHALASICGHRFLAARVGSAESAYTEPCRALASAYGSAMGPEFRLEADLEYSCTAGSLPTWCYRQLRIPAFDVEISPREPAMAMCSKDRTDIPLLTEYQQRHARGLRSVLEMLAG